MGSPAVAGDDTPPGGLTHVAARYYISEQADDTRYELIRVVGNLTIHPGYGL